MQEETTTRQVEKLGHALKRFLSSSTATTTTQFGDNDETTMVQTELPITTTSSPSTCHETPELH